jgi:hypothetical protein
VSDAPLLHRDFEDFLCALCDAGAEFVIVGAYAMSFHGVPRATGDIDILVRPSPDNAARVWAALESFGAPLEATDLTREDLTVPGTVYQIGVAPRRIDVLTAVSGLTFDEAWASRASLELGSRTVHFIGRDALARNKRASGRPKDLVDLEILDKQRGQAGG